MFDSLPLILFGLLDFAQIWLAIPLSVAFALVYAGTRAEAPKEIFIRAGVIAFWIFFFLALVGFILYLAV